MPHLAKWHRAVAAECPQHPRVACHRQGACNDTTRRSFAMKRIYCLRLWHGLANTGEAGGHDMPRPFISNMRTGIEHCPANFSSENDECPFARAITIVEDILCAPLETLGCLKWKTRDVFDGMKKGDVIAAAALRCFDLRQSQTQTSLCMELTRSHPQDLSRSVAPASLVVSIENGRGVALNIEKQRQAVRPAQRNHPFQPWSCS